ncbi:MAG: hypothetical protein ABS52_07745 [Gemmatimonadetes bacterium SCN 70-22]|nr:MAG: hypothetical protein ABS52_07745 [Gemmatimonadetes bacterium SCN 70-22]
MFERAFARMVGASFAIGTSSGTAALIAILHALGVAPGDEVIVSTYGWGSTVGAVLAVGAIPRFADIDPLTACLDATTLGTLINKRTRAILATHMFGIPADVRKLRDVADAHGLHLIFDAAQAMGASVDAEPLGRFGDAVAWSFGRYKLPYVGEGGMITTNDPSIADALVVVSQHPSRARREVLDPAMRPLIDECSLSLRMHPLAAVMGTAALPELPARIARRRRACEALRARIAELPGVSVVASHGGAISGWYSFPLAFDREGCLGVTRSAIVSALRAEGVPLEEGPVRVPIHLRPRWAGVQPGARLAVAERRCEEEYLIASESRWLGVPPARVRELGDAFEKVFTNLPCLARKRSAMEAS